LFDINNRFLTISDIAKIYLTRCDGKSGNFRNHRDYEEKIPSTTGRGNIQMSEHVFKASMKKILLAIATTMIKVITLAVI